jgi:hypothetical protein
MRNWFEIFRSAYASWAATFGTIIAAIALCNLLFMVLNTPITETLAWIFAQYRKTFHPPIDLLFSLFALHLPSAGKDALLLYLAMAGILYRTLSYRQFSGIQLPGQFRWNWRALLANVRLIAGGIAAALLWPCVVGSIMRNPGVLVVSDRGYHGQLPSPREHDPEKRQKAIAELLVMTGGEARIHCTDRQLLVVHFVTLLAAVAGIVCLNGAADLLVG